MSTRFPRLTVAGVGLIGGSLAMAARAAGLVDEVTGFGRTPQNLEVARERGIIDCVATDPMAAVARADLVVLGVPVGALGALAATLAPWARTGAVLTDVGSVKEPVVRTLEDAWRHTGPVVGGHPVAGSEAAGAAAAEATLFRGRLCILTPTPTTDRAALANIRTLWEAVGARVEEMPAAEHDAILARVSHLPHLVAYALVAAAAASTAARRTVLDYVGSGFLDTTRIAASRAEIWRDILLANHQAVAAALHEFRRELDTLAALVERGDAAALEVALAAAAGVREVAGRGR